MPSITTLFGAGWLLTAAVLYGAWQVEVGLAKRETARAVVAAQRETKASETNICNARVKTIEAASQASAAALAVAQTRLEELTPLIEKREELIAVCKRSASCRERGKL